MSDAAAAAVTFRHDQIGYFNIVSAAALLMYEIVLTSGEEIQYIWRSSWSLVNMVYLFARYWAITFVLINVHFYYKADLPVEFCKHYLRFQNWGVNILLPLVDLLIVIRIYALYEQSRRIRYLLAALWLGELTFYLTMIGIAWQPVSVATTNPLPGILLGCLYHGKPNPTLTITLWGVSTAFQGVYVIITLCRLVVMVRSSSVSLSPLLTVFLRDGAGYFFIIFAANLMNTLVDLFGPPALEQSGTFWLLATASVIACRMVLNIRDIGKSSSSQNRTNTSGTSSAPGFELQPAGYHAESRPGILAKVTLFQPSHSLWSSHSGQ